MSFNCLWYFYYSNILIFSNFEHISIMRESIIVFLFHDGIPIRELISESGVLFICVATSKDSVLLIVFSVNIFVVHRVDDAFKSKG